MDRLPPRLLLAISRSLLDELLACANPAFGVPQAASTAGRTLAHLAWQASDALRDLSCTSRAWSDVAPALWRTLLVVNHSDDVGPLRSAALCRQVRILVVGDEDGDNWRERLHAAWTRCTSVRVVIAQHLSCFKGLRFRRAHCTTVILQQAAPSDFYTLLSRVPALRTLRMAEGILHRAGGPGTSDHVWSTCRSPSRTTSAQR